jgi:hypothetical protein
MIGLDIIMEKIVEVKVRNLTVCLSKYEKFNEEFR